MIDFRAIFRKELKWASFLWELNILPAHEYVNFQSSLYNLSHTIFYFTRWRWGCSTTSSISSRNETNATCQDHGRYKEHSSDRCRNLRNTRVRQFDAILGSSGHHFIYIVGGTLSAVCHLSILLPRKSCQAFHALESATSKIADVKHVEARFNRYTKLSTAWIWSTCSTATNKTTITNP